MPLLAILGLVSVALAIPAAMRTARRWREDGEDADRVLRIQREYGVPAEAVEPPRGRRRPEPERAEGTSRYTSEPSR